MRGVSVTAVTDAPLCLLTVHAHPDDEASKGAPTVARYGAEGVRTVLVCCTGGEEGDLQNPSLREPGQRFHGLSVEEEKQVLAGLRPDELRRSAEIIGFDEVVMLGYRDSGMKDSAANEHPECFHMAPPPMRGLPKQRLPCCHRQRLPNSKPYMAAFRAASWWCLALAGWAAGP